MPKKSNSFQRVIALLHEQLAAEASVTESEMLTDSRTGEQREVDIVIRSEIGGYPVIIGVECVDHGRPATVQWVEGMLGKHADLPTDKLILVASSGFSRQALVKAEKRGALCLSLAEAASAEWTQLVGKLPVAYLDVVTHELKVSARLVQPDQTQAITDLTPDTILCDRERHNRVLARELAAAIANRPEVGMHVMKHMHDNSLREHAYHVAYRAGEIMFAVDSSDEQHQVVEFYVSLLSKRTQTAVPLKHRVAGAALVAYGEGSGELGELRVAIVERDKQPPVVEVTQKQGSNWMPLVNADSQDVDSGAE
ncbi:MAG: hypothetical protein ACK5U0_04700 [Gemmatimonas sp.]|jgi:hypothetical protein|uniref:hypothetical protein n=1 Tax=Gemmatimonas sp. TaxID=1962908 RepID=UPI0022C27907|nr:hypothetical protein [Gemmatimonas sp.]